MKSWEDAPGCFDWEQTYRDIINSQSGGILVEVGTYLGRSLCCLGKLAKESGKPFKVVGVDHCVGSGIENGKDNHIEAIREGGGNFAGQLVQNIIDCGLQDVISVIVSDSSTAASFFPDNILSMVFLDAQHTYLSLKKDIECWLPKVRIGGVIGGDDMGTPECQTRIWPDVKRAVDEMLPGWVYSPHDAWIYHKRG